MATSLAILKRTSRSIILLVVCCGAASAQDTTAPTTTAPTAAPTTAAPTTRAPTRAPSLAPTVVETPTCGGEPDPETPCATIDDTNRDALCRVSPFVDQCPAACGTCPVLDCGSTVSEYLSGDGVMYRNFTASTTQAVTFDTCNTLYDTLLSTTGGAEYRDRDDCGVGERICQDVSAGDTVSVAAKFLSRLQLSGSFRLQLETSCSAGACPTPAPTVSTTPAPVTPGPTPEVNYCPSGYADYGVRYNWGLGRTVLTTSHQACADRCTRYSGPQYNGGCKAYQTGMYYGMMFCRSYGGNLRNIGCAVWAEPTHPGYDFWGSNWLLGTVHHRTNLVNVGGNCCSNSTFVEAVAGR